jgi:hypothetical protein
MKTYRSPALVMFDEFNRKDFQCLDGMSDKWATGKIPHLHYMLLARRCEVICRGDAEALAKGFVSITRA